MSERLPRNMVRQIYSMADPATKIKMKGMATWTRADPSMQAMPKTYSGKYPKLWTINKRLKRQMHQDEGGMLNSQWLIYEGWKVDWHPVRYLLAVKSLYLKMKPGDRGHLRDTRDFLEEAFRQYKFWGRYVTSIDPSGFASKIMKDASLPTRATLQTIMDSVLLLAAKWEKNSRNRTFFGEPWPRQSPKEAWEKGKEERRYIYELAGPRSWLWDADRREQKRAADRIARRAARRAAAAQ